ncbi:urease accessory protein UreE [Rhodobacteraceae bacterium CH30]|nr:urease accessory protein UreE [Rhodobacteraceae bacterium CH30]
MLLINAFAPAGEGHDAELVLSFELRSKHRLRTRTSSGEDAGLFLNDGLPLRDGDVLQATDGRRVRVRAAIEAQIEVRASDARLLARAAYHLGNRHVHIEVGDGVLRIAADSVLADMLAQMGLQPLPVDAAFNPETGAYGGGHHHSHGKDSTYQYAPKLHLFNEAGTLT